MSFFRTRKNHDGEKILVTQAKDLGAGCFGSVYRANEVKQGAPSIQKRKAHARVVKRIVAPSDLYQTIEDAVKAEYEISSRTPHLHVKEPVKLSASQYAFIMRELQGEELVKICEKLNAGTIKLTTSQYISLIIALIRAVQSQVDDRELVHRDIKPENIMVDLSNPDDPVVNIIDYGLAKDKKRVDSGKVGSLGYMAPEVERRHSSCTRQSDIFSLGFCILELSTMNFVLSLAYDNKRSIADIINDDTSSYNPDCFSFRGELTPIATQLKGIIEKMCHIAPATRGDLNGIEKEIHKIRVEMECDAIEERHRILNACEAALAVRAASKKPKTITEIKALIASASFADEKDAVSEFVKTLGTRALYGCVTRKEITEKIASIEQRYLRSYLSLCEIIRKFRAQTKPGDDGMSQCLAVLERKRNKYGYKKAVLSLDDVVDAADYMSDFVSDAAIEFEKRLIAKKAKEEKQEKEDQAKHHVLGIMIVNHCERVFGRMQRYDFKSSSLVEVMSELKKNHADEDKDLQKLKCIIRLSISNYIYKTATSRNLFFQERAASERRIDDMRDILQIVDVAKDVEVLKVVLTCRLRLIKTGLFDRSMLRDEVQEAFRINARP